MASGVTRKGGRKNRKWGRNLAFCARYRNEGTRDKNRIRRARRIARGHRAAAIEAAA